MDILNEAVYKKLEAGARSDGINAPRGPEYVISRGKRLHVRTSWDAAIDVLGTKDANLKTSLGRRAGNPSALIVLVHGLGGHSHRPTYTLQAQIFEGLGYKCVAFDFHGHGYSEHFSPMGPDFDREKANATRAAGESDPLAPHDESRCYVAEWEHLMEDLVCVLRALYSKRDSCEYDQRSKTPEHHLGFHAPPDLPFFLVGTSMGGAQSLLLGSLLSKIAHANGEGLSGGGILAAHCDEEYLELNGPDRGFNKSCLRPLLHVSETLWRPFLSINLLKASVEGLTTPITQNSLLVGEEGDVSTPGSEENTAAAAAADTSSRNSTSVMEAGGDNGITEITPSSASADDEAEQTTATTVAAEAGAESTEAVVGLSFIDATLLPIARAFKGTVLLAPALSASAPAWMRVTLDLVARPLFPTALVPTVVRRPTDDSATWSNKDYLKYNSTDHYPHGLSWGKNLRFGTATAMLRMMEVVQFELPAFQGPFLCIMDPADQVVSIDGVRRLMREAGREYSQYPGHMDVDEAEFDRAVTATAPSSTPHSSSDKESVDEVPTKNDHGTFISMPGGGHDCLANRFDETIAPILEFFETRLNSYAPQGIAEM